ncbi:MAG: hypothetical protein Q7Q71_15815 [Verrucomicrobiota bacterium JB023]|nr:hypothetical protein [Verrucomicrobiota bacterium JB023]
MTKAEFIEVWQSKSPDPDSTELIKSKGSIWEVRAYRIYRSSNGIPVVSHIEYVALKDGKVEEWGRGTLPRALRGQTTQSSSRSSSQTPTAKNLRRSHVRSTTSPHLGGTSRVIETRINGDFEGWDGDTIFQLENGQIWKQSEFDFTFHYRYRPKVLIYKSKYGGYKMKVEGVNKSIGVRQLR